MTDPKCEAPPAGPSTGARRDAGPARSGRHVDLYTCTAQTAGQPAGTFVNTANVSGKDFLGKTVTDTDDFPSTKLTAQVVVLPETYTSARRGCAARRLCPTVRSRRPCAVRGSAPRDVLRRRQAV